jgi:hypothetical protein
MKLSPIQMYVSPIFEVVYNLGMEELTPVTQNSEMRAFVWEKKASFSYWRETAGKPPSKLEMYTFVWEQRASFYDNPITSAETPRYLGTWAPGQCTLIIKACVIVIQVS